MPAGPCECPVLELTRGAFCSALGRIGRVAEEQCTLPHAVPKIMRRTFTEPLIAARMKGSPREAAMNKYHFSLVVSDRVELTENVADALYSAGCDDATP